MKRYLTLIVAFFILFMPVTEQVAIAESSQDKFPIGIFWPPSPLQTTASNYADISGMNANFIIGGNGLSDYTSNQIALQHAANEGLKILVDDHQLAWREQVLSQHNAGHGLFVSTSSTLGQTIKTPAGTGWGLNSIQLNIDELNWPAGASITLRLYDSPAKHQLLAEDTLVAPVAIFYPVFNLHVPVSSDTIYYIELTSNSSVPIGWVTTSTTDGYSDGNAYINGTAQSIDLWFNVAFAQRAYNDGHRPADTSIDDIANYYTNQAAVLGYHIVDEPSALQMTRVQNVIRRFEQSTPNYLSFVNLLPNYATTAQLGVDQYTGAFVTTNNVLGQTFTTKKDQTSINEVQWWIDKNTWNQGEALTLKLWDSPMKITLLGEATLTNPQTEWPQFPFNVAVSPNTPYYMELTHNGVADGQIGWVVHSNIGDDWYNDGTAYMNGTAIDADFWYTINQNISGGSYEDYVYRWMYTNPDVLAFDHYPFLANGQIRTDYYDNLEVIRRQAKLGNTDFWSYIQSVGVSGVWKSPTENEMRYQIYSNLAYGAKGYIYFTYWTPEASGGENFENGLILPNGQKNESYYWAKEINQEVLQLGNTLMQLESIDVFHTDHQSSSETRALPSSFVVQPSTTVPLLIGQFEDEAGQQYIMIVNKNINMQQNINFSIDTAVQTIKEVAKEDGQLRNIPVQNSQFTISLQPGEGQLFIIE